MKRTTPILALFVLSSLAALPSPAQQESRSNSSKIPRESDGDDSGVIPSSNPSKTAPANVDAAPFRLLMTHCATDWDAVRFNVETGEAWAPSTDKDPIWDWKKIRDAEQIPAGEYDVGGAYYIRQGEKKEVLLRMQRETGKTWYHVTHAWHPMLESTGFEQTTPPKGGYQLYVDSSGDGWGGYRFNPETGEIWRTAIQDEFLAWRRCSEEKQPRLGSFVWHVVPFAGDEGTMARILRMDPKTGAGWALLDNGWVQFDETADFSYAPNEANNFRLVMNSTGKHWYGYRWDPRTGKTWVPRADGDRNLWSPIEEAAPLERGDYDVQIVCWVNEDGGAHCILRMERKTGWIWLSFDSQSWEFVSERADYANGTAPRDGFHLVTGNSEKGWYALRFHPETGDTWAPNEYDNQWISDRWTESPSPGPGDYDVQMACFLEKGEPTENVYRLDRRTGRCWVYNQQWLPLITPTAEAQQHAPSAGYQLKLSPSKYACFPFRFNPATGETWAPRSDQPMQWSVLNSRTLPPTGYVLSATSYVGEGETSYTIALRMDPKSGRSWHLRGQDWLPIGDRK